MSETQQDEHQVSQNSSESETTQETDGFDASALEADYGMEPGSLAEAKDADSAMEIIRQHADKVLTAGYSKPKQSDTGSQTQQQKSEESKPKKEGEGNSDLDEIRKELQALKAEREKEFAQRLTWANNELNRRLEEEVDSWDSPKYGKSESRSYNQIKALDELRELLNTHVTGYTAQGKQPPTIEKVLKQVRAFHDSPGSNQKQETKPLGTPGAARTPGGGDNEPRSIHHALLGQRQ